MLLHVDSQFGELSDSLSRGLMMDEKPARAFPEVCVPELVIDQNVADVAMLALVDRHDCKNARAWKVLSRPPDLLRSGPASTGKARQNHGREMPDRVEQVHGVRYERQGAVEVGMKGERLPERSDAPALLERSRRHAQQLCCGAVEIGKDAVAIEVKLHEFTPAIAPAAVRPVQAILQSSNLAQ